MRRIFKITIIGLVLAIVMILSVIYFLFREGTCDYRNYDFIDNFEDAEKEGLDTNSIINSGFKVSVKMPFSKAFIKAISIAFANPEFVIDESYRSAFIKKNVEDAGFWIKLLPNRKDNDRYTFYFDKVDRKSYMRFEIDARAEGSVSLFRISAGEEERLFRLDKKFLPGRENTIVLMFIRDRVVITVDRIVQFAEKVRTPAEGGFVEVPPPEIDKETKFRAKFSRFTSDVSDSIIASISQRRFFGSTIWKITDGRIDASAGEGGDDKGSSAESPNLVYVYRKSAARRAVAMPVDSEIAYNVQIPQSSFLEFEYLPGRIIESGEGELILNLSFIDSGENIVFSRKYTGAELDDWREVKVDLDKYAGAELKIKFGVITEDGDAGDETKMLFLANPIIRTRMDEEDFNILVISLDTLRADHLGCYGYKRDTSSFIDEFAEESTLFESCFCHSPWTFPSHTSIFTGLYPLETGAVLGGDYELLTFSRLASELDTIGEYLKAGGYKTFAVTGGGWMSAPFGFNQGFEYYHDFKEKKVHDIDLLVDEFIEIVSKNKNTKWFCFFHTYEIHEPYKRRYYEPDQRDGIAARVIANYDSGIRYADEQVGRILSALKKEDLYRKTLIILTSDHGERFYDLETGEPVSRKYGIHGTDLHDELIKVPLIIGGLPEFTGGNKVSPQVRQVDMLPTILDLCDIEIGNQTRGTSIIPLIRGDNGKERLAYSEALKVLPKNENKSLRSRDYKLIVNSRYEHEEKRYELYDLRNDPAEKNNISRNKKEIRDIFNRRISEIVDSIIKNKLRLKKRFGVNTEEDKELLEQFKAIGYLGN